MHCAQPPKMGHGPSGRRPTLQRPPKKTIRSPDTRTGLVSRTRTNFGDRAISAAGHRVCNYLPTVRYAASIQNFAKHSSQGRPKAPLATQNALLKSEGQK